MRGDDFDSSSLVLGSLEGQRLGLKCRRCGGLVIDCRNVEELRQKLKEFAGSSANFITCPMCHRTIWLTVPPSRELAPIDGGSKRSSEPSPSLDIKDIRVMSLMGFINTIVGIVGLVYGSPWAVTLVVGVPCLAVALLEYKDCKRVEGWTGRILTVIAYVLLGLLGILVSVVAFALLPVFATLVVYLLLLNLLFIVPLTGAFWSPGKYGGYSSAPKPLVWGIRICLALIGLILLFVWVFLR